MVIHWFKTCFNRTGYPEFYLARLYLSHGSLPPWRMDFNSAPHKPRVEHSPTRLPFSILNGSKETDGTAGNRWGNMRVRVTIRACEGGRGLWIKQKSLNRRRQGTVDRSAWYPCGSGSLKRSKREYFILCLRNEGWVERRGGGERQNDAYIFLNKMERNIFIPPR